MVHQSGVDGDSLDLSLYLSSLTLLQYQMLYKLVLTSGFASYGALGHVPLDSKSESQLSKYCV